MALLNMICVIFTLMAIGSSTDLPVYKDEEAERELRERTKNNLVKKRAYLESLKAKDDWINKMTEGCLKKPDDDAKYKLGSVYSMSDVFVKKTHETDLQIKGGKSKVLFYPIDKSERAKMRDKGYRTIHLDGFYVNCESMMPAGSEGFAIMSLYDTRFIDLTKGFLGMIGFPLGKLVSHACLRVNYPISTYDEDNWVAIITVYDHNLKDESRPCNFHIKSYYKYTNNIGRFSHIQDQTDVGKFKIPIKSDPSGFALESVRNSLDYSVSVLNNANFLNELSDNELACLKRSSSINHVNRQRMIENRGSFSGTSKDDILKHLEINFDAKRASSVDEYLSNNVNFESNLSMRNQKKDDNASSSSASQFDLDL